MYTIRRNKDNFVILNTRSFDKFEKECKQILNFACLDNRTKMFKTRHQFYHVIICFRQYNIDDIFNFKYKEPEKSIYYKF